MNLYELFRNDWVTFLEMSHDGIVISDSSGKIVYVNSASERLMEISRETVIGKYVLDLEREGVYETTLTTRVLNSKKPITIMQYKGDKQIVTSGTPIFEDEQVKWVFINERDITELSQIKQENLKALQRIEKYKAELALMKKNQQSAEQIISKSPTMRKLTTTLYQAAPTDITILLEGETGTGKSKMAGWIHDHSSRSNQPFVEIDCGALPESLLESELFGYAKGAFTGADREGKKGLIETADGGTLFLDEVGDLPFPLQVKLLRLLQNKTFLPIGSLHPKKVDVRIIAATNRNLAEMVRDKLFREDLYYRLNVVSALIPPLREREEDIYFFILQFLDRYNEKHNRNKTIHPKVINLLQTYSWPGNIRQLSNLMERLVITSLRDTITVNDVAAAIPDISLSSVDDYYGLRYNEMIDEAERQYFESLVNEHTTIKQLASRTGLSESTVKRKLRKHKLRIMDLFSD